MMRCRLGPCALLLLAACLPDETRTPPGTLVIEAAAVQLTNDAVETDDGWSLTLERVYASIGRVELEGDDCEAYSDARYTRLLDFGSSEPQRVSLLYGLGACSVAFALSEPRYNTQLGAGVPANIEHEFRTPGDDGEGTGGVSLSVSGKAIQGTQTVSFVWRFRGPVSFNHCRSSDSDGVVALASGAQQVLRVELDALQLFRSDTGQLHFAAFAAADAQASSPDGSVSFDELRSTGQPSLLDDLYHVRLPRIAAMAGVPCAGSLEAELR
jgi:hypothetical protein